MCICISYSLLRRITEISAILVGILGIFGIIFGGVLLGKNKSVFDDSGNLIGISYGIMLGLGFILLIVGIIGLIAWKKRNNCLLGSYIAALTIVVICSIVVFGLSSGLLSEVKDSIDDNHCEKKDFLKYSRLLYEKGQSLLCSQECQCKVKQTNLNAEQKALLNWSESQGSVKAQECSTFKQKIDFKIPSDLSNLSDFTKLLGYIEDTFDCSGFCQKYPMYIFSNTYNGKPKNRDCKIEVLDFLDSNLGSLASGALAVMIISIISCIFSCSLCCHKEKRDGTPYYDDYERTSNKQSYYK